MKLDKLQTDRAVGVLMGQAAGDALGVPYEFAGAGQAEPVMKGGGLGDLEPGQWSDDTELAVVIAQVAAAGADLRTTESQDRIATGFLRWFADGPPDVGIQTRHVLSETARRGGQPALTMRQVAADFHTTTRRRSGNGSLMRTGPVAVAHLGDSQAIAEAARAISALTHADPVAQDACVLWTVAIDHTVRTGQLDVRVGLSHVDERYWAPRLDEAERVRPSHYVHSNGWVVDALLGAWSAISATDGLVAGLHAAVRGGGDTDTVAAIAGQLLGARYGGSAVPGRYRRRLHGWPGLRSRDLTSLAVLITRGGTPTSGGWPTAARLAGSYGASDAVALHPDDAGVVIGSIGGLQDRATDAVVSLCRLGTQEAASTPDPADHVEFWLIDEEDANLDASSVVLDAARTVRELRREGKTVYVHCVHAHSRAPSVAAAYGSLLTGRSFTTSMTLVQAALAGPSWPRRSLVSDLVRRSPSEW